MNILFIETLQWRRNIKCTNLIYMDSQLEYIKCTNLYNLLELSIKNIYKMCNIGDV